MHGARSAISSAKAHRDRRSTHGITGARPFSAAGSRDAQSRRSAGRALRCRPEHGGKNARPLQCAASTTVPAQYPPLRRRQPADGAEPSGRGSRLSTAEAVRGIVQRHVQERHWRAQPTHPRGTYHREATDLRSAARDSSQNDRDDRRDTLSRSLSRRILAKCPGHEMQPRIGRTQLPSMSL